MRKLLIFVLACTVAVAAYAYKTAGDGTLYTFEKLSQIEGTGVTKVNETTYVVLQTDTIAEGDSLTLDDLKHYGVVRFGDGVGLRIEGVADLSSWMSVVEYGGTSAGCRLGSPSDAITFTRNEETDRPFAVTLAGKDTGKENWVHGVNFEYIGLRIETEAGVLVTDCWFDRHNGAQSGAVYLGADADIEKEIYHDIDHCNFTHCEKAAIGGAANISGSVGVTYCKFVENSQLNQNIPQLNLTASKEILIDHCILEGDSTKNMSGGIGISNFFGTAGNSVKISNCRVKSHRYGITTMGVMDAEITDCTLTDNRFEQNPMNGGSGISFYDPYQQQTAKVSDCLISGSLWGVTVIGCKSINLGRTDVGEDDPDYNPGRNIFRDNGFDGQLYDLYNNSTRTVYAQNNTWNVSEQTQEQIETVIFHQADDASLGEVVYMPAFAGEQTGIAGAKSRQPLAADGVCDLAGRKVTLPGSAASTRRGVYIVNGRKIIR